jgi:hypothetical protein
MTRTFTKLLAFSLVIISSFAACTKTTTQTYTKAELIGTYTIISIRGTANNGPEQDLINVYLDECQKDDLMVLKDDLSLQMVDAGTTCVPSSNNNTGDWDLIGNTFYWNGEDYRIKSLTNTNLVIDQSTTSGSVTETITVTFIRR